MYVHIKWEKKKSMVAQHGVVTGECAPEKMSTANDNENTEKKKKNTTEYCLFAAAAAANISSYNLMSIREHWRCEQLKHIGPPNLLITKDYQLPVLINFLLLCSLLSSAFIRYLHLMFPEFCKFSFFFLSYFKFQIREQHNNVVEWCTKYVYKYKSVISNLEAELLVVGIVQGKDQIASIVLKSNA